MESVPENADKPVLDVIYERARAADATIILAESEDPRVQEAAEKIRELKLANLLLLTDKSFSTLSEDEQGLLVRTVQEAQGALSADDARELLATDTKYLASALVKAGKADGFVAGNATETSQTIRPAIRIIGTSQGYASSFFLMLHNNKALFFADCGFNVDPDAKGLARIAVDTAENVRALGIEPRVAFLSFSTGADLDHDHIKKMRAAIEQTRELNPSLRVSEHELQFDAAFEPDVAAKKAPMSQVAGKANIFIFPDLNSGNIGYKIAQRMGGAQAIGPILQGFNAPVNDLSRGCSPQEIINVVAFTAMQAGAMKKERTE